MSIFQDPIKADNWLRTCEHQQLRADTARYEASQADRAGTECCGCGEIFPESELTSGACPECWGGQTRDDDD